MLQGDRVTMVALGVSNDTPPNAIQPKLATGIHLRATFERDLGFPWYGFYLFRRESQAAHPVCLGGSIGSLPIGPFGTSSVDTPLAHISSDQRLVVCDDFPALGRRELDLENRRWLRVDLAEPAWKVTATIGIRGVITSDSRVDAFQGGLPSGHPIANPLTWAGTGVELESFEADGKRSAGMKTAGPPSAMIPAQGVVFGAKLAIRFFETAANVTVELLPAMSAATIVTAFDAAGQAIGSVTIPKGTMQRPSFAGPLRRIEIQGPPGEVTLQRLLYTRQVAAPSTEVRLTAFTGTVAAGEQRITGAPGQMLDVVFELDGITRVDVAGAAAALLDLCAWPIARGANSGWAPLPRSPNPIALPVVHASYPLSAPNVAAATALALSRVRYGPASRWQGTPLQELQTQLAEMVKGGPAGTPMGAQKSAVQDSLGTPDAPSMPALRPLDLVLLGALHPALAQIVGLYHVDEDAPPDKTFDYMIVADYAGAGQKDPAKILALVQANDFSKIEAFIVFNKRCMPAPPLPQPKGLTAFALPGMTVTNAAGALVDATNNVGLNWDAGRAATGELLPGKPILHHVWRADLGNGSAPQTATTFRWLTGPENPADPADFENPVFVTTPRLPGGAKPERRPGWPPPETPLHYIDRALADGWFQYKINDLDIFGRHSPQSAGVTIRVRDLLPPPPPTAVEAWVLDEADPSYLKDAAHKTWRAAQSAATGLRVRWTWTAAHARQAPDTREFRIYFHPGSEPPSPDARTASQWQTRYFVVPFDKHVTAGFTLAKDRNGTAYSGTITSIDAPNRRLTLQSSAPLAELSLLGAHLAAGNAPAVPILAVQGNAVTVASVAGITAGATWDIRYPVRVYDVLIPVAGDPPADVPLTPTIQDPLLYAHVGVTAIDDKTTPDHVKWASGPWGNRTGNESAVSTPAKVFRVLRKPPEPAQPVGGEARVYATRANIEGESFYTYRWTKQPSLRTHVFRALFDSLVQTDWRIRTTRTQLSVNDTDFFPTTPYWDATRRQTIAAALNGIQSLAQYEQLSDDALRILAGLPGNDLAFSQITIQPLGDDRVDARGPDDPAGYVPNTQLLAYRDTLPGLTAGRYFYRSALVTGAHNISRLGLAGPPVYVPNVRPPLMPVLVSVIGGDRAIALSWRKTSETLKERRVYRATSAAAAADLRDMERVATLPPAILQWKDTAVIAMQTYSYRVTSVDLDGLESAAAPASAARAYDDSRPDPPVWGPVQPGAVKNGIVLKWSSPLADLRCLVQRKAAGDATWTSLTAWLGPGVYQSRDDARQAGLQYTYRLLVRDNAERQNRKFNELTY
jgi:hypothetical protein